MKLLVLVSQQYWGKCIGTTKHVKSEIIHCHSHILNYRSTFQEPHIGVVVLQETERDCIK